jgi:DUF1680 family protein
MQSTKQNSKKPVFESLLHAKLTLSGLVGERIKANERNWLLTAPKSNPAMIEMFHDRDRTPPRELLPWSGEFAGKYLTSAVECYRLTHSTELKKTIQRFVKELIASQDKDGYMGPFAKSRRMLGKGLWDLWGQYHCMLGLYWWYQESGDTSALKACRKTADLFCETFLDGKHRAIDSGSEEMNESCIHIFTLLYEETGEARYLQLAKEIVKDFETPPSGDYIRASLAGKPFYQTPKPRWEGLHAIQGIAEMYSITGEAQYRQAFEQIWWTIAEFDRHNTGGFSSGEQAQGNPYDPRAIETCCTIAWMAISVDMLRMTGDSHVADELELSLFNGILGAQEPNGRWWTYNTPMDGHRKAATQDIDFQERPGSPELSCCSVNAPRGIGMLSDWALMRSTDGVVVNYYGPGSFETVTPLGKKLTLTQKTEYPREGKVLVSVALDQPEKMTLSFRIPSWSASTTYSVNGEGASKAASGKYLTIERTWKSGDRVELDLDFSPWYWVGERECKGKASVYIGPLLLAYDPRFDVYDPRELPVVDLTSVVDSNLNWTRSPQPWILKQLKTTDGKTITLCDFASAGMAGNEYVSWLKVDGMRPVAFSKTNPLRCGR